MKSENFHGQNAAEVIFTQGRGGLHTRIVSRDDEVTRYEPNGS